MTSAKSLTKTAVLDASDDPKDQDKARERRVKMDFASWRKQTKSGKTTHQEEVGISSAAAMKKAREDGLVYSGNEMETKRDGWRIDARIDVTYDVFKVGVYDGEYLSEDFFFCRYLREMGYKILVDPSIPTRHNGNYVFAS